MSFEHINNDNFTKQVLQSDRPYLLEFGAVWCGPCKRLEPELEKLQSTWGDRVRLGKLDVDEAPEVTMQFSVISVPTLMLFVDGEVRERLAGFQPAPRLIDKFEPHI